MIDINYHFCIEFKAHNFHFQLPPHWCCNLPISYINNFTTNRLRSLSADSRGARPSRAEPSYIHRVLRAFTAEELYLGRQGKKFFSPRRTHTQVIPCHQRGSAYRRPSSRRTEPSRCPVQVPQKVFLRPCLLGPLLEEPSSVSR